MNNKLLVGLFAAIMFIFLFRGVSVTNNVKDAVNTRNSQIILTQINQFEKFLYCVGVLGGVIIVPLLFKKEKKERKQLAIKIQEIKKRGDREKMYI